MVEMLLYLFERLIRVVGEVGERLSPCHAGLPFYPRGCRLAA
jgi:hypothetical protein